MATFDFTVARPYDVAGIRRRVVGLLTGGATYLQASGESLTAVTFKLGTIEFISQNNISDGSTIYFPQITYSGGNAVITWYSATGTQVGNGDLSTFSGRFEIVGY